MAILALRLKRRFSPLPKTCADICAAPYRPRIIDRSELRWRMKSIILRQDDWSDRLNRPMDLVLSEHYATNYYYIRYRISSFRACMAIVES